jgi:hypothetical protein
MTNKNATHLFPNGFDSWMETHHEIVSAIALQAEIEGTITYQRMENQGIGGLYELGKELTNQFEKRYPSIEWDGNYFDNLESFLLNQI